MISIRPTQNVGRLKPRMEPAMMVLLYHAWGFIPATSPSGMPSRIDISIAQSASSTVAGMRSKMSCTAGMLCENERPRSPLNALVRKSQYCTHIGLSSPSAAVARAISAWSAWGLIRMSIGLPIANTPTNIRSDITSSATTLCSILRMMNTSMVSWRAFFPCASLTAPGVPLAHRSVRRCAACTRGSCATPKC